MVNYNREALICAITREYKFSEKECSLLINYVNGLSDELQSVVDTWIDNGTILEYSINGVDISYIMNKMGISFLAALVHMNKFIANPNETERFKKLRVMNKDANPHGVS